MTDLVRSAATKAKISDGLKRMHARKNPGHRFNSETARAAAAAGNKAKAEDKLDSMYYDGAPFKRIRKTADACVLLTVPRDPWEVAVFGSGA